MMKKDHKAAAQLLAEGMACSPADSRLSVRCTALALAELAQGELDNALESATNACREDDRLYLPRLALEGVHLIREEQTQAVAPVQESLRTKPDLNLLEITCVLGERLGAVVMDHGPIHPGGNKAGSETISFGLRCTTLGQSISL